MMPVAPSMLIDSSSGWCSACSTALQRLILTFANANRHQRAAAHLHHLADMGKVDVDQPGLGDQLGDALDALAQNIICQVEGQIEGQVARGNLQQAVIGDGDQRIGMGLAGAPGLRGHSAGGGPPQTRTAW